MRKIKQYATAADVIDIEALIAEIGESERAGVSSSRLSHEDIIPALGRRVTRQRAA